MKKLLIGLLALSSLSAFANLNGCKVNILENQGDQRALVEALEKHGYEIVATASEANFTVVSSINHYTQRVYNPKTGQVIFAKYRVAETSLYAGPMDFSDYITFGAAAVMGIHTRTLLVQGSSNKILKKAALLNSVKDFDDQLDKANFSCRG